MLVFNLEEPSLLQTSTYVSSCSRHHVERALIIQCVVASSCSLIYGFLVL